MTPVSRTLFGDESRLVVRDVVLSVDDEPTAHREKLARVILDELYEFVGLLDADGMTLEINRAALEGAGVCLDDIRGKPFWEARWWAVSHESVDESRAMVARAGRGEFVRCDTEVYGRAGGDETILIDYSLTPIRDASGRVVFLLPEGRNITDKKRAEAELARRTEEQQQLLDKVRRLDRAKSDFFANVSHELRTPLSLILGPTKALLEDGHGLGDGQRHQLEVVERNAVMLLKQVNALLDLAMVDAGRLILNYASVDLGRLVRTAAAHFDALAPERHITFVVDTPTSLVAEIDPDRVERIVWNLLSNAFKFTPDQGRIRCRLEAIGVDRALLTVQDSGPGVAHELRSEIFERFNQGELDGRSRTAGTGLGLAIAKEMVDLHDGTITVTDAPGGGALFQVEIPLHAPANAFVRTDHEHDEHDGVQRATALETNAADRERCADRDPSDPRSDLPLALIVEDHPDMRRFIVETLRDELRVVAAADGHEALRVATAEPPDLIVTDLMMPQMTGEQLVRAMRAQPHLEHVPILIVSARADDELRLGLLASSVQDYVTKPFSAHELRARVRNLVTTKRARDALQRELASHDDDLAQLTAELIANQRALQASHATVVESERRWRAVYENSAAGIALLDTDGRILSINPAFCEMLRCAEHDVVGLSLLDITSPEDRDATLERLSRLGNDGATEYRVERRFGRLDGTTLWVNASVSLAPGSASGTPMIVCVVEDITERNEARTALSLAQTQLERVTRATALGELAASIAHEVNQPLAAIAANGQACLRWLAAEPSNHEEVTAAAQRIVRDASRASEVISRIRTFLGRGGVRREAVDLVATIDEVITMVGSLAQAHGVHIVHRKMPTRATVVADPVQVHQVILNLVLNGIEVMAPDEPTPKTLDIGVLMQPDDQALLWVRDRGRGIDPADVERVFDPFFTSKVDGMGMGLAVSRSIVEAHGGRIWVEPNARAGATFLVRLPSGATTTRATTTGAVSSGATI